MRAYARNFNLRIKMDLDTDRFNLTLPSLSKGEGGKDHPLLTDHQFCNIVAAGCAGYFYNIDACRPACTGL